MHLIIMWIWLESKTKKCVLYDICIWITLDYKECVWGKFDTISVPIFNKLYNSDAERLYEYIHNKEYFLFLIFYL